MKELLNDKVVSSLVFHGKGQRFESDQKCPQSPSYSTFVFWWGGGRGGFWSWEKKGGRV